MTYDPIRGGHAPGHLRAWLYQYLTEELDPEDPPRAQPRTSHRLVVELHRRLARRRPGEHERPHGAARPRHADVDGGPGVSVAASEP